MSYSTSYASLCADIVQMTEDDSEDFRVNLDNIIRLGEAKVLKDLDLKYVRQEVSVGSTTASSRTITRPTSVIETDSLWITVSGSKVPLKHRSYDYCVSFYPDASSEDTPVMYAEPDLDNYYLVPTPDTAYTITAFGLTRPDGLTPDNQTSWIATNYGDVLLFACLVCAEGLLSNKPQVDIWKEEYMTRMNGARRELGLDTIDADPKPQAPVPEEE